MKRKYFNSILLTISVFFAAIIFSCGDDSVNATQDFVSGTITYLDTNLNYTNGYYGISLYGDSTSPFTHRPLRTDSLAVNINNGTASAYYKISNITSGHYYIGSTWVNRSNGNITVFGVYGCDQNVNCTNPTKVEVPNYAGTGSLNFKSATH